MEVELDLRLITVSEYHQMVEARILAPKDRVELIQGKIIHMSPIGSPHAHIIDVFTLLFIEKLGRKAVARVQNPVTLGEYSEPEPDLVLAKSPHGRYSHQHPGPEDILLVVEVASSSLRVDKEVKIPLYAKFGIPKVWLVDLEKEEIWVYSSPENNEYLNLEIIRRGESQQLELPALSLEISLKEIFTG
ncbi:MAG: Uma2 family endonuclease [Bacteroidota bacterium]